MNQEAQTAIANQKPWPTLDEVRAQLWETNQRLYQRIEQLEESLVEVKQQLQKFKHDPHVKNVLANIDAALKEPK
jgi:hypothetical protein